MGTPSLNHYIEHGELETDRSFDSAVHWIRSLYVPLSYVVLTFAALIIPKDFFVSKHRIDIQHYWCSNVPFSLRQSGPR
jgi:hypothetical protein